MNSPAEMQNKAVVEALYKALANGTMEIVAKLVASDLEWWFHGPPQCHHMMRVLTGEASHSAFRFEPRSVEAIGDCVIAEGWKGKQVYWVHVWTLKDGMVTLFREYFNTWLTVQDTVQDTTNKGWEFRKENHTLWQSNSMDIFRCSMPGLVLAI